jgi:hypothetical protein
MAEQSGCRGQGYSPLSRMLLFDVACLVDEGAAFFSWWWMTRDAQLHLEAYPLIRLLGRYFRVDHARPIHDVPERQGRPRTTMASR